MLSDGLIAQPIVDNDQSTLGRILRRVVSRDKETGAILAISAQADATYVPEGLTLSIKKIPKSDDLLVELAPESAPKQIVESYRVQASQAWQRELDKLALFAKKPKSARNANKQSSVVLNIRHVAQDKNLCATACASMAIHHFGEQLDQHRIKELANSVTTKPDFAGTYYSDIVTGLATQGYVWQERHFPVTDEGFVDGLSMIIASLNEGEPVIIDTHVPPDGHTVLVVGYDAVNQQVALLDPFIPAPGIRQVSYAEFRTLWKSVIVDVRGGIFTHRKSKR
jgi:hypothetical protein